MRARDRRRRGVDYNQEVAFEKAPAIGFYDTAAEKETTKELGREFRPLTLEEMEGRRRKVTCCDPSRLCLPSPSWTVCVHNAHAGGTHFLYKEL